MTLGIEFFSPPESQVLRYLMLGILLYVGAASIISFITLAWLADTLHRLGINDPSPPPDPPEEQPRAPNPPEA